MNQAGTAAAAPALHDAHRDEQHADEDLHDSKTAAEHVDQAIGRFFFAMNQAKFVAEAIDRQDLAGVTEPAEHRLPEAAALNVEMVGNLADAGCLMLEELQNQMQSLEKRS